MDAQQLGRRLRAVLLALALAVILSTSGHAQTPTALPEPVIACQRWDGAIVNPAECYQVFLPATGQWSLEGDKGR